LHTIYFSAYNLPIAKKEAQEVQEMVVPIVGSTIIEPAYWGSR